MARGMTMPLVAMALGVLVIANDFTALNVALPAIEEDFDVDVGTVQWTINAYALTFGMVLVTGGRLADMFGRRRIFFIGTGIFAVFSALGALAPSAAWLIGARVGMGVGGGLMWPAILGITFAAVPAARAAFAGGLILGVAGLGNAIGPLVGGALTEAWSWRAIFWLNLPIAAFAAAVTWAKVHQPREATGRQRIDYAGIASLSLGLVLVLLALDQSVDWGFGDPRILIMLVVAALSLVAFVFIERRMGEDALVPESVIANRGFSAACITVLFISAVFFTTILYAPQLMEKVLDYSALEAGLALLPMMGVYAVVAFSSSRLSDRFGLRKVIIAGTALLALGPLLLSYFGTESRYLDLVPGLLVTGIGIGLFFPSITTAAVTMLDPSRSSLAGGIVYMFQVAGGAIGLGLATAIFTLHSENVVAEKASAMGLVATDRQISVIHGILAGTESGRAAFQQFGTAVADELLEVVRESFVAGVQLSLRVIAAIAVAGLVVAIVAVRPPEPTGSEAGPPSTTT